MSTSDSTTLSTSSPYGTRSSTWSPATTAKSESLSPKLCAVAEEEDQDVVYDLLSTMSDPAAQDAAATLSRVANSGAPIASTSTAASTSSAVLAAAALMAGSNPSASTSTSTHDNDTSHDTSHDAIPDPTLTAVASPNAQLPANYNKDLPMCANCLTQMTPLWRRSHDSTHILCNACALFFKMKGRPRPISLKTNVIKSRNRSKGKSTSKDRSNPSSLTATGSATASPSGLSASTSSSSSRTMSKSKERSMSRSRDGGVVGRKSGPGMDEDDAEMEDGRNKPFNDGAFSEVDSNGRKARKTVPSPNNAAFGQQPPVPLGYPGAYPYPYPYYQPHPLAHPHPHHPYPSPRSRSRSADGRRAQSLDSRPTSAERASAGARPRPRPYGYPPPPPPGYHPANPGLHATAPPEGYYPPYGYPPPPVFIGQHQMPPGYYPPLPFGAHSHAQAQAQAAHTHSQAHLQQPAIAHAQSDSRSRSPATAATSEGGTVGGGDPLSRSGSAGLSASPARATAPSSAPYPGPSQLPQSFSHSPLGGAGTLPRPHSNGSDGRFTLAPLASNGNRSPRLSDDPATLALGQNGQTEKIPLPSFTTISGDGPMTQSVFGPQHPRHRRATSVSSTSAASVVSTGSAEDGVRSPETNATRTLAAPPPWAQAALVLAAGRVDVPVSPHDERRGRPEKRERDAASNAFPSFKGKGREGAEDLSEIDELDGDTADDDDALSNGKGRRSMMGVEASLGDLRVDRHRRPHGACDGSASPLSSNQNDDSSRSRSSGRGTSREGRGRSRVQYGGGTAGRSAGSSASRPKAARQGSGSSSMSRSAGSNLSAEAQIQRLKNKVAELTFLNGLMVSRLSQLEGPGRVPLTQSGTMTSLFAETPRPSNDYPDHDEAFHDPAESGGDEEMYGDEALREDEELESYGVSVSSQDPAMRHQLLAFFRAQRAGHGGSATSARAEA